MASSHLKFADNQHTQFLPEVENQLFTLDLTFSVNEMQYYNAFSK